MKKNDKFDTKKIPKSSGNTSNNVNINKVKTQKIINLNSKSSKEKTKKEKQSKINQQQSATKQLYSIDEIKHMENFDNSRNTKAVKIKKEYNPVKIYLKSVLITLIFCMIGFLIVWAYYYTTNTKSAEGDLTVPMEKSSDANVNFQVLLKSAYTNEYLESIIININFKENKINLAAVSSKCQIGENNLKYYYDLDGPAACSKKLYEYFNINAYKYFDLTADQLYDLTKKFGNVTYNIENAISYYDKKTGNSFLAGAGYNKLTGSDCVKMIEYYINGSFEPNAKMADKAACQVTRAFILNSIKGSNFYRDDFIFVLNNSKNNVSSFEYEDIKKKMALFLQNNFQIDIIENQGVYSSEGFFTPSADFKSALISKFN